MTAKDYKGGAKQTALNAPITNSDMTFTVTAGGGTGYPTGSGGDFVVAIDTGLAGEEKILCSARSTDTFTVASGGRGYDDTTASAHSNLAKVDHVLDAATLREMSVHMHDTGTAAHAATAISYAGSANLSSTNVEAALDELDSEKSPTGHVHAASAITYAGSTNLSSTNVEAALDELDAEKSSTSHTHAGTSGVLGAATVATAESTSSNTYTDLATSGPAVTVTVPASGSVLLSVACQADTGSAINHWEMSAQVGGSGASQANAVAFTARASEGPYAMGRQSLVTGLTPSASVTITAKYLSQGSGPTTFSNRTISVLAV